MNNRIIFAATIISALLSCAPKKQEETNPAENVAMDADTVYENPPLTEQQIAEGWQYLFDGETLTGWRSYQNKEQNCWEVQNGTLHCKSAMTADKRADILIEEPFQDYYLSFEWKATTGANGGLMYHVSEEFEHPYLSGPEYQLMDDSGYKGELTELTKAGGVFGMYGTGAKTLKPAGEWNQGMIVVAGTHIEHWLNGTKILTYEMGSEDWKNRKAAGKWKEVKGYGMTKKGFIDLQDHGYEMWFRKIMIRSDEYDG